MGYIKKRLSKGTDFPFWHHLSKNMLGNGLIITEFGWHTPLPLHSFSESRGNYLLEFVIDGVCLLEVSGNKYTVRKGSAFLIPPKTFHKYTEDSKNPSKRAWISFIGADAAAIASVIQNDKNNYIIPYRNPERLIDYINELYNCRNESSQSLQKIYACFYRMLSMLKQKQQHTSQALSDTLLVNDILQYILLNLRNDLSINTLCKTFKYSQNALYKKFKAFTGVSPKEFIIERRIGVAKNLLSVTELSFEEIATACGYFDIESLNKLFFRHEKQSLSQYRKAHKAKNVL